MDIILKQLVLILISPLNFIIVFACLGFFYTLRRQQSLSVRFQFLALITLIVFTQPIVSNWLLYPLEHKYSPPAASDPSLTKSETQAQDEIQFDFIYVPACYYHASPNLPEVSRWHECSLQRLVQAAILANKSGASIVLTGGNFLAEMDIDFASQSAQLLDLLGIDEENIIAVGEGTNTRTEVESVLPLLTGMHVAVVSSATHYQRLNAMLSSQVLTLTFYPVHHLSDGKIRPFASVPTPTALEYSRRAFYEYSAIMKDLVWPNANSRKDDPGQIKRNLDDKQNDAL